MPESVTQGLIVRLAVKQGPNEKAIELLEAALADARSGKLKGFAIATTLNDGCSSSAFSTGGNSILLLGAIERMRHRVITWDAE